MRADIMGKRLEMKVVLEDPAIVGVPTLFANHVAVARAGTEVQFEFVAVDINSIATKLAELSDGEVASPEVRGKTVTKVVVPLHVFLQLEPHLRGIFSSVRQEFDPEDNEATNEHNAVV